MPYTKGCDHDGLLQGLREADGGEWFDDREVRALNSDEETSIDAAQSAIRMLVHFVEHIKAGKREQTLTLVQIGRALAGEVV